MMQKKTKKVNKEWYIDAPWGKIALVSWGDPNGPSVLLVHGRQDSVSTFVPILEYLPESYHYVGLDLPGHGKSDGFPIGVMQTRFHFVVGLDYAVKHLKWDKFAYFAHSMGCELGLFYNAIYPNRITKFVLFDPLISLQMHQCHDYAVYFPIHYQNYYDNYDKINRTAPVYTKRGALNAVMKARNLSESQAELVLERNLIPIGDDKYRISWDLRLRGNNTAPQNFPVEYYYEIFSRNTPPTLIISATDSLTVPGQIEKAIEIIDKLKNSANHFYIEHLSGGHDIHLTRAETVAKYVVPFLNSNFSKAKL